MNSQDFLIINAVGAGAFVLWYLAARGGERKPTQLNMHAKDSEPVVTPPDQSVAVRSEAIVTAIHPEWHARKAEKNLNIIFNYNGHSWDAYEVLGVPAGASMPLVTQAYQQALRDCDKTAVEFLETAYKAILHRSA